MQVAERFPDTFANFAEVSPTILYPLAIGCGLHTIEVTYGVTRIDHLVEMCNDTAAKIEVP